MNYIKERIGEILGVSIAILALIPIGMIFLYDGVKTLMRRYL